MVGIILNNVEENRFLTGQEFERTEFSVGDMARLSMKRTLRFSPTQSLARMLELDNLVTQNQLKAAESGPFSSILQPNFANKKYGIPDQLSFDQPVFEGVAALLHKRKIEEMFQDIVLAKAEGTQRLGLLGLDLLVSILDPINVGASFIPIVGQARYAAMLTRFGTTKGRALRGLIEGTVGNAMVEPIVFAAAKKEQANYTELDTLMNITFGGILGTGLHVVGGRIGDSVRGRSQRAHQAAVKTSVNQMAQGGQVQVEPILGADNVSTVQNVNIVNFDEVPPLTEGLTVGEASIEQIQKLGKLNQNVNVAKAQLKTAQEALEASDPIDKDGFFQAEINQKLLGIVDEKLEILQVAEKARSDFFENVGKVFTSGQAAEIATLQEEKARREATLGIIEEGGGQDPIETLKALFEGEIPQGIQQSLDSGQSAESILESMVEFAKTRLKIIDENLSAIKPFAPEVLAQPGDSTGPIVADGLEEYVDLYYSKTRLGEALNTENLEGTGEINLGSQIGEIMIDKATNKKFYVKTPESPVHAANEFATALFYKSLGANIPDVRLVMDRGRITGVASEFIEGLKEFNASDIADFAKLNPDQHARFMTTIVFDAWLANRDVYSNGNLFLDANNELLRLDFGGGLLFRAMGGEKTDFKAEVTELKTFKDDPVLKKANSIWNSLPDEQLDEALIRGVEALAGMDAIKIGKIVGGVGLPKKEFNQIVGILTERHADILFKFKDKVDFDKASSDFVQFFDSNNAVKHSKEATLSADFTAKEVEAINEYQGGSPIFNSPLRKDGFDNMASAKVKKLVLELDSALLKSVIKAPIIVYRGGVPPKSLKTPQTPDGVFDADEGKKLIGHVISDRGFMGTSPSRTVAINFGGGTGNVHNNVMLRLYLPAGHHVIVPNAEKNHTFGFTTEVEFIMPRDMPLQIIASETLVGTDLTVLTVRPVAANVQPSTPKAHIKMAKAYKDLASSAADDDVIEAEFAFALSEAFKIPDERTLLATIQSVTDDLEVEVKGLPDVDSADVDAINVAFTDTVKAVDAIKKGALKAFKCVLGKLG